MEIWARVFPRCSKMLYCGPNEGDYDGEAQDGGGYVGGSLHCVDIGGPAILSQAQQVVTINWVSRPLMLITLIDDSTCDM